MVEDARIMNMQRGGAADTQFAFVRSNFAGEQLVTQGFPPYVEMARRGLGWSVMMPQAAAVAALVTRPTTTAMYEINNTNTAASGIALVIDRAWAYQVVATAAVNNASLWLAVLSSKAAVTDAAYAPRGNTGKTYSGAVKTAVSTTVVDQGWFPWGPPYTGPNTTTPGGAITVPVEGRLIIPPGGSLAMHVVASLVGDTFCCGASWYEVYVPTE